MPSTGADEYTERALKRLEHAPGETVTETVEFPSVLWGRVVLEKPDDVPIDEYIEHLVGLALLEIDARHLDMEVQADVELSREQWERLRFKILAAMQAKGEDAETAFWNNVHEHIQTLPNLVVDGETVGPDDLAPTETRPDCQDTLSESESGSSSIFDGATFKVIDPSSPPQSGDAPDED